MNILNYFIIRATNEENNDYIVTIGKHLATETHFKTKEEAKEYISTPHWDTTIALFSEMLDIQKEQILNELKNKEA